MVFWAGLIAAVAGSVAGVMQKRRSPDSGPLAAVGVAVATFVLLTAIGGLVT